jgi:pyruvate/2-oxoglutarate dehydrogenase complex dihydrolipoamide dehydrogenase (E3) component
MITTTCEDYDMETHFDLLVIGFGKGGKTLAANMARRGDRVAMVEQSDQMYGGTCINIGCVPTKSLVHLAETSDGQLSPDDRYRDAITRTDQLTTALRGKNFEALNTVDGVTIITGRARFTGPKTVQVTAGTEEMTLSATTIVINTGAEPALSDIPGLRTSRFLHTSTTLLHLTERPRSMAILGGGSVGIEFASIYTQFGTAVTVLDHAERLLPREDADVAAAAVDILTDAGTTVVTGARVTAVTDDADHAVVHYDLGATSHTVHVDAVLAALGRTPATAGLGLDAAGVTTNGAGEIVVDQYLRTSQPHVFAVGDVNGGPQFTYISLDDHRIVLDQLTGTATRSTTDRVAVPYTVFTSPPLARTGMTEREALDAGRPVRIATKPIAAIAAMPRARIVNDTRGLMKFVIDRDTDEILGAALLCIDAQELINLVALAIRHKITATELRDTIYTHPSATEGFNEVLAG